MSIQTVIAQKLNLVHPIIQAPMAGGATTVDLVAAVHTELGLPLPTFPKSATESFEGQFAAALESGAAIFSFTLGILPPNAIAALKSKGMYLRGTATTVEEAASTLQRLST